MKKQLVVLASILAIPTYTAFAAEATTSDKFAQVRGFAVEIAGVGDGGQVDGSWEHVTGGELIIEMTETTVDSVKFQTSSPGHKTLSEVVLKTATKDADGGRVTAEIGPCANNANEVCLVLSGHPLPRNFSKWMVSSAKGKNIRKNITVKLYKSDKSAGRSYSLYDCFPMSYSPLGFDTSATVQTETLTVKIGRIEFKT